MSTTRQSMVETHSQADLHQLLVPTSYERSHVPPRDSPPSRSDSNADSYFVPERLSRTNSAFSFSRATFGSQLATLTSMTLPKAETLAAGIAALPNASRAVKALNQAAEQIQSWTGKALKVLKNLDADDDVEWAAAAGRDGLDDMDKCISSFEHLISVYVQAIEELQSRDDIGDVRSDELTGVVEEMEVTLVGWDGVRSSLKTIHDQVELAMEFQELWNDVLGDVGNELDNLSNMVFEMEEKRHMARQAAVQDSSKQTFDLHQLESALGEQPFVRTTPISRFSLPPAFESSPLGSPVMENPQDDSDLLALFARMQPLKASIDFVPMRLTMFQGRAAQIFPQACEELSEKKVRLEKNWTQLSKDAENLRRELSEDRWVVVFRNAGRQAKKMCESVERSVSKVREAIDEGYQRTNPSALAKRVESFQAKKMHYGPAVERVLVIIQRGLKERLTVNGEILRLQKEMSQRARQMQDSMEDMEQQLGTMNANQNSRLRESISSIVSADQSFCSTTFVDTPGSSPASSIDLPQQTHEPHRPKYGLNGYTKTRTASTSRPPPVGSRRSSILPQPRRPTTPMSSYSTSTFGLRAASPAPASVYRQGSYQPPKLPTQRPGPSPLTNKPRWSSTINPRSVTTPVSCRRATPGSASSASLLPFPSPLGRDQSMSPTLPTPVTARRNSQQYRSFAERVTSPTSGRGCGLLDPVPYHRGRNATAPPAGTIRSPSSLGMHLKSGAPAASHMPGRPASSLNRIYAHQQSHVIPAQKSSIIPPSRSKTASGRDRSNHSADLKATLEDGGYRSEQEDQVPETEPTSSPLAKTKTMTPRPGSSAAGVTSSKGRRVSMLPVPTGRTSSMGHRMGS